MRRTWRRDEGRKTLPASEWGHAIEERKYERIDAQCELKEELERHPTERETIVYY